MDFEQRYRQLQMIWALTKFTDINNIYDSGDKLEDLSTEKQDRNCGEA